jgi:hypothetical protein
MSKGRSARLRDLQGVLARIWRALKPAGLFYASFKEGNADGSDTIGRYHNYPSEDWLKECYRDAGSWSFRSIDRSERKGFDGADATIMHVWCRNMRYASRPPIPGFKLERFAMTRFLATLLASAFAAATSPCLT